VPTNQPIRRPSGFVSVSHLEGLESRRLLAGTGLAAQYFNNDDFSAPVLTRTEAINFDWQSGAPAASIGPDTFSVRWQGLIEPKVTGAHTFHFAADDGVRVWVDGSLIINAWYGPAAEHSGSIALTAGKKVGIKIEFREISGTAHAKLEWSAPGLARQVVPASALYEQLHNNGPLRIITLGDSITEGDINNASYRFWLQKKLISAGYNVDFVGTRRGNHVPFVGTNGDPIYPWFDQDHQSRWGGHLDELHAAMPQWAALNPDVALIHIGHNDIRGGETPQSLINHLSQFIDELRGYLPNIKIALAKPVKNTSLGYVAEMDEYRALIPGLVAAKSTAQSPVIVVDQYDGFHPETDTYDNVHPNAVGERKIARRFMSAIEQLVGPPQVTHKPVTTTVTKANVTGLVFNDTNGNGVRDTKEWGLANRYVYLDYNNNAKREANEPIAVTNAQGQYLFRSLPAGNYRVRHHVTTPSLAGTSPANHVHIVKVGAIVPQSTYDFGVRTATARISGNVFHDANRNGLREANEAGVANRYVFLDANNNGTFDAGERWAVTDSLGVYVFNNVPAGTHRVRPVIGPSIIVTQPSVWAYWVTLANGQHASTRIFGIAAS
jgi:acyl-CoA thioesterase I